VQIWGSMLTAWGATPDPTVTGDSGVSLQDYWASDDQVNASYTVSAQAAIGSHSLTLETAAGVATGSYNVACRYPQSESSQNPQWCQSCTGGTYYVQLLEGGVEPPNGRYQGRVVNETITGEIDGCYFVGSDWTSVPGPPGGPWTVGSINTYGGDLIGMPAVWVTYYHNLIKNGLRLYTGGQCTETDLQSMYMNSCAANDQTMTKYDSHWPAVTVTGGQITVTRGNGPAVSGPAN